MLHRSLPFRILILYGVARTPNLYNIRVNVKFCIVYRIRCLISANPVPSESVEQRSAIMKAFLITVGILTFLSSTAVYGDHEAIDPRAVSSYLKGVFLESRHDLANAYKLYAYAERLEGDNPRIKLRLARVSLQLGDLKRARINAETLLESGYYGPEARMILIEIDYMSGNREAALKNLLELRKQQEVPKFDYLKLLARLYLEMSRRDEAQEVLEEAKSLYPGDLFVLYRLGLIYGEAGETDSAVTSLEKAIDISPGFVTAYLALASILRYAGRLEEAKDAYRKALEFEPIDSQALKEFMELLYGEGEYEEGISLLEPLQAGGRLDEGGLIILGRFYYRAGKVDRALEVFRRLNETMGDNPSLLRVLSEIELERGRFRVAYDYMQKLIELEPDNFANYIGLILIGSGLAGEPAEGENIVLPPQEVSTYIDRAAGMVNAGVFEDNYIIGTAYRRAEEYGEAERFLLRAERLKPDERRILLEIATLYERMGRLSEALERIVRLYEKDSGDASVANFYGYLLAEMGDKLDLAESLLMKALEMEPRNGYFMDSLGWIKYRKGELSKALEIFLDAVRFVSDDPVIWEHLGDTYLGLDMKDKALDAFRRSSSMDSTSESAAEKASMLEKRFPQAEE